MDSKPKIKPNCFYYTHTRKRNENQNQKAAKTTRTNLRKSLKKCETEIHTRGKFKAKTQRGSLARHPLNLLESKASSETS